MVLLVVLVVVGAPDRRGAVLPRASLRSIQPAGATAWPSWVSALLFGLAHFELLQLPALVLFGLVAGYCVQRTGRLGLSIWAHIGFNAVTIVVLLAAAVRGR